MNQKEYSTTFPDKPAIIMAHIYAASLQTWRICCR